MKRLRIEHQTGFSYQGDVTASYNEARMLPGSTDSQFVLNSSLDIEPSTSVNQYVDYFGTRVAAFDVLSPHSSLTITARSLVEVRPRPLEHIDITWDGLAREASRSLETVEQLTQTGRTRPHAEVAELVGVSRNTVKSRLRIAGKALRKRIRFETLVGARDRKGGAG